MKNIWKITSVLLATTSMVLTGILLSHKEESPQITTTDFSKSKTMYMYSGLKFDYPLEWQMLETVSFDGNNSPPDGDLLKDDMVSINVDRPQTIGPLLRFTNFLVLDEPVASQQEIDKIFSSNDEQYKSGQNIGDIILKEKNEFTNSFGQKITSWAGTIDETTPFREYLTSYEDKRNILHLVRVSGTTGPEMFYGGTPLTSSQQKTALEYIVQNLNYDPGKDRYPSEY